MTDAIIAGHLCLDIIPDLSAHPDGQFELAFQPGRLLHVGAASISTGGAVSNTGLALHRLGIKTRLFAKVGADQFGHTVNLLLAAHAPHLAADIQFCAQVSTSYSIVISPPGSDRTFLHHPGANDDFCAADVCDADLGDARLFHFGYPPLMARMFANDGAELTEMLRRVKALGLTTSLDMALPDPNSAAGRANWSSILKNTLPYVDIFLPSLDEILFMLGKNVNTPLSAALLTEISDDLLAMGAKMIVLKLGQRGLYLRTAALNILQNLGRASPSALADWANYENWLPCFQVDVIGTNGAGDATIAGFLAALLRNLPPLAALNTALAVGACNVEAADSLSGICSWQATQRRMNAGWARRGL